MFSLWDLLQLINIIVHEIFGLVSASCTGLYTPGRQGPCAFCVQAHKPLSCTLLVLDR